MIILSLSSPATLLTLPRCHHHHYIFQQNQQLFCNPKLFSLTLQTPYNFGKKIALVHGSTSSTNNGRDPKESKMFLDENGVVDDMEGFLNDLSLEYDSVWDTKPSWCQPWTITLTGILITFCSWLVLHSVVVTFLVLSLICAWWYIFLYSYPKAYSDMIADRRKKVTTGVEDTFGSGKSP